MKKARLALSISTLFVVTLAISLWAQSSPDIPELDADGCQRHHGKWTSSNQGIPGDGNRHNFSVHAPNGAAHFLGGSARGYRMGLDQDYSFTCMINPPQPASVENTLQRRCIAPGNDMSVERCQATSGSTGALLCEYVNATNAPSKMMELGGCWE